MLLGECSLQERDGMRAILESYDTELAPTEYSPQLSKRLQEAEDVLQKTQSHNAEMEVRATNSHLSYPTSAFRYPGVLFFSAQNLNINNTSHSLPLLANLACMLMNGTNTSHIQRHVKCVPLSFYLLTCSVLVVGKVTDICSGNWWNSTCSWQGALWATLERNGEGWVNELHTLDNIWPLLLHAPDAMFLSILYISRMRTESHFLYFVSCNFFLLCSVVRFRPSWAKHKKRRALWSCSCKE